MAILMCPKLKVAKKSLLPSVPVHKETASPLSGSNLVKKIVASPTKSALIPFALRAVIDFDNNRVLTPLQAKIVSFLRKAKIDRQLSRRYESLPKEVLKAFDERYFKGTATEAEKLMLTTFASANKEITKQLKTAFEGKKDFKLSLGFSDFYIPQKSLAVLCKWASNQKPNTDKPPADVFNLQLDYRGITTLEVGDRSGGVEPYIVPGIYKIFDNGDFEEVVEPTFIQQNPWNLGKMQSNEWMPSGGDQDANGNPTNPITIFSLNFPPYDINRIYCAAIKVMEEDGGYGAEIAAAMGAAMLAAGYSMIRTGWIGAAIVIALGSVMELLAAIWSSSEADDFIGDIMLFFDISEITSESFAEISSEVTNGGNYWKLYFGKKSTKL